MLCCTIIIILYLPECEWKYCTCIHVENGHVCPSGLLSWTVAFRSIVGMLLMMTLSCFTWTKNYSIRALSIASLVTDLDLHIVKLRLRAGSRYQDQEKGKIISSGLCAEFRFRQNIVSPSSTFNKYKSRQQRSRRSTTSISHYLVWSVVIDGPSSRG